MQIIRNLEEKNQQSIEEITTLESSNRMLRQQVTASLSRGNKEK